MAFLPGEHVLVRLVRDPGMLRHYVVLSHPVEDVFHFCLTPSRQVRRVDFSSAGCSELFSFNGKDLPGRLGQGEVFLAKDSRAGDYTEEEIRKGVATMSLSTGHAVPLAITEGRVPAEPPRRLRGKTPTEAPSAPAPRRWHTGRAEGRASEPDDGEETPRLPTTANPGWGGGLPGRSRDVDPRLWFVMKGVPGMAVGSEVDLRQHRHVELGELAIIDTGPAGQAVLARARPEDVHEELRRFRVGTSGLPMSAFRGFDSVFAPAQPAPAPAAPDLPAAGQGEEPDVRVLEVELDSAEERFRTIESSLNNCYEYTFPDWPLDGVRSTLFTLRQLRRSSQNFLQHHESWATKSGIRRNDRAIFEHQAISRCLHLFQYYDQLQICNLAGVEGMVKRMQLIERAYRGSPDAPNYAGQDHFLGVRDSVDGTIIDPANVRYTADRLHVDYEVLRSGRLAVSE